jgi:arylsulfatase A-like enzyme/Flp pilus assembly protein TadD
MLVFPDDSRIGDELPRSRSPPPRFVPYHRLLMQRKLQIRVGLALGFALLLVAGFAAIRFAWPAPRLNVLLVTLDTTRADHIGCYGYPHALTPALDALAEEGVLFENAYVTVPMTVPSHAGMLTGLYPPENGLHNNGKGALGAGFPTLAERLGSTGYDTAAFIAAVVLRSQTGLNRGFQTYDDEMAGGERHGDETHLMRNGKLVVDAALPWLQARQSRPFFCWVHLFDPHAPFEGHAETFGDRFRERPYDGDIAFADLQIGRLVADLKERGLYERTVIVVVGDHGEGFGEHQELEHGFMLYNSTLRVPLIVRTPAQSKAGHRVPTPVSLVDLFPTILDALQLSRSERVSGVSLAKGLKGESIEPRPCYSETDAAFAAFGWAPLRSVVTDRWKYVHTTRDELYDLERDPRELHNLADSNPEPLAEMRELLASLEQQMVECPESKSQLTAAQRRQLASLGYVTGARELPAAEKGEPLPDVKDKMPSYNAEVESRLLMQKGNVPAAIERLRGVIEAAPEFIPARLTLAKALMMQNKLDEATDVYAAALAVKPDSPEAHFDFAKHCFSRGQIAEAIEHYAIVVKIDPSDSMAHFNLATILVSKGEPAEARRHYELGLEAFPDSTIGQFNYGVFLGTQGDLAGALEHVGRALRLSPRNPQIHYQMGILFASKGDFDEAADHFEETLRLNSRYPNAAEQLDRAKKGIPPES